VALELLLAGLEEIFSGRQFLVDLRLRHRRRERRVRLLLLLLERLLALAQVLLFELGQEPLPVLVTQVRIFHLEEQDRMLRIIDPGVISKILIATLEVKKVSIIAIGLVFMMPNLSRPFILFFTSLLQVPNRLI